MKNHDSLLAILLLILVQVSFAKSDDTALGVERTTVSLSDNFACPQLPEATYTYTANGWIDSSGNTIPQPFVKSNETVNILSDYTGEVEGEDIRLTFYVGPGATFKGTLPKFVGATVILHGALEQENPKPMNTSEIYVCSAGSMIFSANGYSVDSGNHFYNAGTIRFTGNVNMNSGVAFTNYSDATLVVNGVSEDFGFQFNGNLVNYGKIYVNDGNMYLSSPSTVSNFCTIYVKNDLVVDHQLNNNGLLLVEGRLELDAGQIVNSGIADFGALVIDNATGPGAAFMGDGINSLMIVRTDAIIRNGGAVAQTRFFDSDDGGGFDTICETCKEDIVVVDQLTIPETEIYIAQCGAGINSTSGTLTGRVYYDTNGNGSQDAGEPGRASIGVVINNGTGEWVGARTDSNGDWVASITATTVSVGIAANDLPEGATLTEGTLLAENVVVTASNTTDMGSVGYKAAAVSGTLTGMIYDDVNGNGIQDAGESGLENVTVIIRDVYNKVQLFNTTSTGAWKGDAVLIPTAHITVDCSTLPLGSVLTAGKDTNNVVTVLADATVGTGKIGYTNVPETAALHGLVYEDSNANGTRDSGESGLENVEVTVTTVDGLTQSAYTTSVGTWSLMALPIGEAKVAISEDALRVGAVRTQGVSSSTVTVTPGANTNTGDMGYTIPNAIGKLTGRVYNDHNKNGIQDAGEPGLENAWVFIASEGQTRADVYTDANGDWEASLVASRAEINIVRETLPTGAFEIERYPVLVAMVADVTTNAGSAGYGISSEMVPLSGLIYKDSNGNGTQDTDEPGLDNVVVNIAPESGAPQHVITSADGRWTFPSVPVGVVIVDIDDRTLPRGVLQTQGDDPSYSTTVANANNPVSVAGFYTPIGTLKGFVYYDDNKNGIQDGRDYVLESVSVIITDSYGVSQQVMTGSDGTWNATVLEGVVTVDIDNATIPEGATLTIGQDPKEVTVVAGEETDTGSVGYSKRIHTRPVYGTVYEDSNGNGTQDDGEPGLNGVAIKITDAEGFVITATTTPSGVWSMYLILGETTIDVDETTLPVGATLTEGVYPVTVTVTLENAEADRGAYGYAILPQIGFLEGIVYDDSNGNGIQDGGELGLDNVIVKVTDEQGTLQSVTTTATGLWDAALIAGTAIIDIDEETLPEGARLTEGEDPMQITINPEIKTNAGSIGYTTLPKFGILSGLVYADSNGNGTQDTGELGLASISIAITDSQGTLQTVTTSVDGDWNTVLYEGVATIAIDDATVPSDAVLTAGKNPYEITVIGDSSVDAGAIGYRIPLETGAVSGLVYFDENGNGIQDQEELGLPDVVVSIIAADDSFQTVITNETGIWSAVVTEGIALITVDESTLPLEEAVLSEGGDPSLVNVIAGADINGGVLGYTVPLEMGVLSGVVYSDLDGNGNQNVNEPGLVGVIVVITDSTGGIQTITTDEAGRWVVTVFEGETIVDIDIFTLPDGVTQTEGTDSTIINVVASKSNDAGSAGFEIVSDDDPEVTIHDAVSPNGDGMNDVMVITGISSFYYTELMIFNRWSQLVYDTTNYGKNSNVFDGYGNNQEVLPSGTYMYIFKYRATETSKEITKSGHLYLQR